MLPVVMVIIVISLVILTEVQFLLIMFHLTLMTKLIKVNDNDNNGFITWDDVVAMEDAARELEEVPVRASPPVIDPNMARTATPF